ncbi:hypothetical protein WICPIJ_007466 [Wickerhamomyces pijperi]|uniref:Uncharacterized protein n=1 Tax=Wickerhamomyces pijperi TaxID=599730 RepID=A0A9P8Q0I4_WICPI|nr:hypothetical protein WICPIJ_007466 [Wickerhamomyces pijperi]
MGIKERNGDFTILTSLHPTLGLRTLRFPALARLQTHPLLGEPLGPTPLNTQNHWIHLIKDLIILASCWNFPKLTIPSLKLFFSLLNNRSERYNPKKGAAPNEGFILFNSVLKFKKFFIGDKIGSKFLKIKISPGSTFLQVSFNL